MGSKHIRRILTTAAACIIAFSASGVTSFAENALYYEPTGESADFVGASLVLSRSTITLEEAQEPQYITLYAKSPNNTPFESTGIHILFDDDMEILPIDNTFHDDYADCLLSGGAVNALDQLWNSVFICTASSSQFTASEEGTPYCRVKVKLLDPKPGKKYNVTIAYRKNDLFTSAFSVNDTKIQDYAFSHVEPGYIIIEDTPPESSITEVPAYRSIADTNESELIAPEDDDNDSKIRLSGTDSEVSNKSSETLSSISETSDIESESEPIDTNSSATDDSSDTPSSTPEKSDIDSDTEVSDTESTTSDDSSDIQSSVSEKNDINSNTEPGDTESKGSKDSSDTMSKAPEKPAEPNPSPVKPERSILKGDVNGDGKVDIEDAVAAVNFINGTAVLSDEMIISADVCINGTVDVEDVAAIINHINGVKILDN